MISFEGVVVRVPTHDEPRTIIPSLTAELGEHRIALIGPNGSGKSTIARLINGLVTAAEGRVRVGVRDDVLDPASQGSRLRQHVGFVFTDPRSQLVMPTVAEDLALSLQRRFPNRAARREAVIEELKRYGLEERASQSVHSLSGGQQQLLALASVLALEPAIIVADEPTTLLDLRNSRMIGDLLMNLNQQVVIATHDLALAARCDRALVIEAGSIVFDGPAQEAVDHYRSTQ